MRLSAFILANMEPILQEWEDFARDLGAVTEDMDAQALRDHARSILEELAEDLETHQTEAQEKAKSKGKTPAPPPEDPETAAEHHGGLRAHEGFSLEQMVSEYRSLRASVLRLWGKHADSANERMAALGTLSAGLGHDMSNVLAPMRMSLDELRRIAHSPEAEPIIDSLLRSVEHLRGLTRGLRSLSVDSDDPEASAETTDLREWWTEATSPYQWALGRDIRLHTEGLASSSLPPVRVPKHVLMQAVFNLVQNAAEALASGDGGGGNIWVSAAAAEDGATVNLAVRDDGPGMDPQTLARCTEPFFTTKHRARGTGLGLALVRTTMERHASRLIIDSQPGKGSTFTLVMPAAERERKPGAPKKRVVVTVREPRVRATILALLAEMDAEVSDAAGTEDASLWIADDSADPQAVRRFLDTRGPTARVLALGDWGSGGGAESAQADRVIRIDAKPSYTTLQGTLGELLKGRKS